MKKTVVADRFKLGKKIGSGSFGEIYLCEDIQTRNKFAAKLESRRVPHPQLPDEKKIYHALNGVAGFPPTIYGGYHENFFILVMQLLGPSLEDFFNDCNRKFSLKTVLLLADQMITRVETLHEKGFIHRDIKPENFLMGLDDNQKIVHLIDFGLAKRYINSSGAHIPFKDNKSLTGTARYASVNTHKGIEQSRRDDLESLGYLFVYFLKGSLPWQGIHAATKKQKYEKIAQKKDETSVEKLCKDLPNEFKIYMRACRDLKFTEKPNYSKYKGLFKSLFDNNDFKNHKFEWLEGDETVSSIAESRVSKKSYKKKDTDAKKISKTGYYNSTVNLTKIPQTPTNNQNDITKKKVVALKRADTSISDDHKRPKSINLKSRIARHLFHK